MKYYLGAGISVVVVAAACLFLTTAFLERKDEQMVGKSQLEETQEVILSAWENMTLLEKVNLIQSSRVYRLSMENGRRHTRESEMEQVKAEFGVLLEKRILRDCSLEDFLFSVDEASLIMDMDDSERSLICWSGEALGNDWEINWTMDDETGKILGLAQGKVSSYSAITDVQTKLSGHSAETDVQTGKLWIANGSDMIKKEIAISVMPVNVTEATDYLERVAESWASYLDCQIKETGYAAQNQVYYRAGEYDELNTLVNSILEDGASLEEAYYAAMEMMGFETEYRRVVLYAVLQGKDEQSLTAESEKTETLYYFSLDLEDGSFYILNRNF